MGNWQLEVGKMIIYMGFPVGMFYLYNHPESYEKEKARMYRPPTPLELESKKVSLHQL